MGIGDFLRKDAETPLREDYIAGGAVCSLSTNCRALLDAANESFLPVEVPPAGVDFSIRFWIDNNNSAQPPWPKPYVRGLDHLVFAGFDSGSSMIADLRTRRVIGRFTLGMASDRSYWRTTVFPIMLTIVAPCVGIAELHCACVAQGENGVLLAGPSGCGKSTLATALAQAGFGFLSDDRTFCSHRGNNLYAWGLPTQLKLRGEARDWFRQIHDRQPTESQKGEPVFVLEPERDLTLRRVRRCQLRAVLFLEQQPDSGFEMSQVSPLDAMRRLDKDLMAASPDEVAKQSETLARLVGLPCWLLRYDGRPQVIARMIAERLERAFHQPIAFQPGSGGDRTMQAAEVPRERAPSKPAALPGGNGLWAGTQRPDPLRRLTPTPYVASLPVMGRTLRLETNNLMILRRTTELFATYPDSLQEGAAFRWRIVSQAYPQMGTPWPRRSAFSDLGLRFAEFGQRNFLAVDLAEREAVAFISEKLAEDALGFTCFFLDTLFYMTAGALGLVSLSAACVAQGTDAILVMGPPDQGKTTACYWAARNGLKFHADQAVFLEKKDGRLRAWGDFFPLTFRPQALQFIPELRMTQRFSYCDQDYQCLDRQKFDSSGAGTVIPVCCVVLEREAASEPKLIRLAEVDGCRQLCENFALKEEDRWERQRTEVLDALADLPAYRLAYGSDPAVAAGFLHDLIVTHKKAGR